MSLEQCKVRRDMAANKLKKAAKDLDKLCASPSDTTPTEAALTRKMAAVKEGWESVEKAHVEYAVQCEKTADIEVQLSELYEANYDLHENSYTEAEELLSKRKVKKELADLKDVQDRECRLIKQMQDGVTMTLEDTTVQHTADTLEAQGDDLKSAQQRFDTVLLPTYSQVVELDISTREEQQRLRTEKSLEVHQVTQTITSKIALLLSTLSTKREVEVVVGATGPNPRGPNQNYFEKRPFPKFSGEKRDFPSFRKEWTTCIGTSFREKFQLREIRRCVPKWADLILRILRPC